MFQTPWFLVAILVGPLLYRRFSPELRPWVLVLFSVVVVASADITALGVVGLGALAWFLPFTAVGGLLLLRPLSLWLLGLGGPLGASYVAFRVAHVAIDARRGDTPPIAFAQYLAWLTFFPIWSAGPIERFDKWSPGLAGPQAGDLLAGWHRLAIGVCKKSIGAQLFAEGLAEWVRAGRAVADFGFLDAWAYVICMFIWGYLDFSAYSDIAIGAARTFGFRLSENFNFPFVATNLADYWRRWHMTLLAFCQRYVYMPALGYTRSPYLATFATFGVMGLWHGPSWSWVAWGLYHATGMVIYIGSNKLWRERGWGWPTGRLRSVVGWVLTLGWVVAAASFTSTANEGLGAGLRLYAHLLGIHHLPW